MAHTHVTYESITLSSIEGKSQTKLFQISNDENPISWEATYVLCHWTNRNRRPQTFLMLLSGSIFQVYLFHPHTASKNWIGGPRVTVIHFSNSCLFDVSQLAESLDRRLQSVPTICVLLPADHSPWSTINALLFGHTTKAITTTSLFTVLA